MICGAWLVLALTADRDFYLQSQCLGMILSILFFPKHSRLCPLSNRDVRKDEPPEPSKNITANFIGSEAIALHSIREMRPWSFDAATLKSEPVQPVPSVIINRTARRYRGSFLQILSHQSPVS